jgi:hypothetical protein
MPNVVMHIHILSVETAPQLSLNLDPGPRAHGTPRDDCDVDRLERFEHISGNKPIKVKLEAVQIGP